MSHDPIDSTLHGVIDYTRRHAAADRLPAGWPASRARARRGRSARAGAIHAGYSTLTDYPLGIVKLIPYQAHLAIDALGALALAATPFVTGQCKKGRSQWVPARRRCALFELASLALTDPTGRGDFHGDVDAVRRANMEDPHRKIYDGRRAVDAGGRLRPIDHQGRRAV